MFASRLTPLDPFRHTADMLGAAGFRIFGALQPKLYMFLMHLYVLCGHVLSVLQKFRMTLSNTFHALLRLCFQLFQTPPRIVDTVFEYAYKWLSYLAPMMLYFNINMAGGKIPKVLENQRKTNKFEVSDGA
jgi:hypothetical protein